VRHFLDELLGRSDRQLAEIVVKQVHVAIEGALLARHMTVGEIDLAAARTRMASTEHVGDRHRADLVNALSAALTTPIDREDLFRLSRFVDDVLDGLRDFVRESHLYELPDQRRVAPILDALIEGLGTLEEAVRQMSTHKQSATTTTLAAKKASGRVRQLYQSELAEIFKSPLDVDVMKRRELLRRIDVVGIRFGEAADALADGLVKRSR
jgi:uncharacterized protein Yka (UPF0111/DUF47 family)